jgi:hypothetical protein
MSNQNPLGELVVQSIRQYFRAEREGKPTGESMASLMKATSDSPLTRLNDWERLIRTEYWKNVPDRSWTISKLRRPRTSSVHFLDLCSCDGFARERALRELPPSFPNGFFFAFALRRLNDWVPQVRAAARERIPEISICTDPELVVDGLWATFPFLASWGRMEQEDRDVFVSLLSLESVSRSLKSRIVKAVAGPATRILTQAGRSPVIDPWLLEIASEAIQPSVRAKAYRVLLESKMSWIAGKRWEWTDSKWCEGKFVPIVEERFIVVDLPFTEILKLAIADSSSMVRRLAGDFLIGSLESFGADARSLAQNLASDSSPSVAERGIFALSKLNRSGPSASSDVTFD